MLDYSYNGSILLSVQSPVRTIDLTDCLKQISWGLPAHEAGSTQTYEGQLTVVLSCSAEARGLVLSDFDQVANPSLWLPGTAQVVLVLSGTSLKFRLSDWRFDQQTKTGTAKLTQQLALYNQSLPDADKDFVSPYEIPVAGVITRAADVTNFYANDKIVVGTLSPYPEANGWGSVVYGQMSAKSLWSEAQSLLTHTWAWLSQSLADETVTAQHLDYEKVPVLLSRAASQVQSVVENSLSFVAPKVLAYGAADLPAKPKCEVPDNAADNGYPADEYTEERMALDKAMPDAYPRPTYEAVVGAKYVKYYYRTPGRTRVVNGPGGVYSEVLSYEPEDKYPMNEQSQLWKVVTENRKSLGMLFPDLFPGMVEVVTYETITETYEERITERALGLLKPDDFPGMLVQDVFKREQLKDKPTNPNKCGKTIAGEHVATDYVRPAPVRAIERPLETQSFKAEVPLVSTYRPALNFPYLFDIGWCPTAGFAELVAKRVVVREKSRSLTDQIQMPLPKELIERHCPVFFRAAIGSKMYFADQIQYQIDIDSDGKVQAGCSFLGCTLGSITTVPEPASPDLYLPAGNMAEAELSKYSSTLYVTAGVPF